MPRKHTDLIASGIMGEDIKISDYSDYSKIEVFISDVDEKTPFDPKEFFQGRRQHQL